MGSRTERKLLENIEELGYVGIKVDTGGGKGYKTGHDAGDLIVGRKNIIPSRVDRVVDPVVSELFIIEEKYSAGESEASKYIREDGEKLDSMIDFAESIGAKPVLAVRWSTRRDWGLEATHYLADARYVDRTESGNVSVKPGTAEKEFEPTEVFFKL